MLDNQAIQSFIGRSFGGYRATRYLARGGMSVVFEGVQESLDRPVAIKILYPHLSDDGRFTERFEREARAAARLNHPNIVRILDFGSDGPLHYMVQDFIDGESLRERLARLHAEGVVLRPDVCIQIIQQIGAALAHSHRLGYVHRDVKPGNILLSSDGRALLADFGLVKIVGNNQMTGAGVIIGTPEYMAPEQSSGAVDIGPEADQYSLAIVTYEMIVGRVPFQAPTPLAVMRMHLSEPPPPPSSVAPWVSEATEAVLMRALAKDPGDRFPSVDDFVSAFSAALSQRQVRPVAPVTPAAETVDLPITATSNVSASTDTATTASATPPSGAATAAPPGGATAAASAAGQAESRPNRRTLMLVAGLVGLIIVAANLFYFLRDDGSSGSAQSGGPTSTSSAGTGGVAGGTPLPTGTTAVVAATVPPATTPTAAASPSSGQAASAPTVPASDGRVPVIVFSSHRGEVHDSQIYIMADDGSSQRQFTASRGHSWGPRVSPDGTRVFYSSVAPGEHIDHQATGGGLSGSGNHDIYLVDITGTGLSDARDANLTNLTVGLRSWDNGWSWSPDGRRIAFTSDRDGNWEVYVMSADGKDVTRLTNHPAEDGWPTWTPDGQRIIFSSNREGRWQLFSMDNRGANVTKLPRQPDADNLYPNVSPDGKRITFSAQHGSVFEGQIFVMDVDGSDLRQLTSSAALNNIPSWCPDNNRIVFVSDRTGNEDIFMINADGTGEKRLTTDPGEDTTPVCTYITFPR